MFEKGEVVVCVDNEPDWHDPKADLLVVGRFYRIGAIGPGKNGATALAFRAPELRSDVNRGWAFRSTRFRKLPKADQSFTDMIRACKPVKEPA